MQFLLDDTIAAIATAPFPAERGILRVTGPNVADVIRGVFACRETGRDWQRARLPSRFTGEFLIPRLEFPVPGALHWWPSPRSYTGQPVAEFQLPGAPPILDALLEECTSHGARLARRGEFTLRAFLAGRIDLLQAEAVLGVIDATDHHELQQALSQLGGSITHRLSDTRSDLIALLGDLEAGLDFVEEDIEFVRSEDVIRRLSTASNEVSALLNTSEDRMSAGIARTVVLAGLPNAGKSTLFNAILQKKHALVSPIAGTTRDYLSARIDLRGLAIELVDTAGWENAADSIEAQAQQLRQSQIRRADLVIWCHAAGSTAEDQQLSRSLRQEVAAVARTMLDIHTRADLDSQTPETAAMLPVSGLTGEGLVEMLQAVRALLTRHNANRDELLGSTSARCRDSLVKCVRNLDSAADAVRQEVGDEIVSMEIRQALRELSAVMGEVYTDDILDHIFSSFCIGK